MARLRRFFPRLPYLSIFFFYFCIFKLFKASIAGLNLELDEYKRELTKIELIKEAQNQNLRKSKIIVILFVIVFFVLLMLIFTLIRNNSFKRKVNRE